MNKKKILISLGKILLGGILAFAALTAFCFFYYNIPTHRSVSDGATDYKWEPNVFYSRGTEGFACGRINNDGYVNMFDHDPNRLTDVLIMGSSHMEAFQVAADESTASRLNALLPDDVVYNIGVSGHRFATCASNLEAAISKYRPSKCVVIETAAIDFSTGNLADVIDGTVEEIPSHSGGILGWLQKNQCLRLLYAQLKNFMDEAEEEAEPAEDTTKKKDISEKKERLLDGMLEKISGIAQTGDTRLVILYHPYIQIGEDGNMQILGDQEAVRLFETLCDKHGISFLDMSDRFIEEYEKNYVLPYGFINSTVGSGHMNRHGHAMAADELYKLIGEME